MSTIKSSAEHLTLNADGASKDIKFQANGVEKASISSAGAFTSTTIDATALTGNLPAISGASLTGLPGIDADADSWARVVDMTDQGTAAVLDWTTSIHLGSNITESGGRITVGTAGWYLVSFHISNASAQARDMSMHLRKNTSQQLGNIFWQGNTEINYLGVDATVLVECAANDILDIYGSGYYAGDTGISSVSWFTGVRIGA